MDSAFEEASSGVDIIGMAIVSICKIDGRSEGTQRNGVPALRFDTRTFRLRTPALLAMVIALFVDLALLAS